MPAGAAPVPPSPGNAPPPPSRSRATRPRRSGVPCVGRRAGAAPISLVVACGYSLARPGYPASMNTAMYEAATRSQVFGYVLILVVGAACVGGLIWAFRLGFKVRQREPAPPRPEEQPKLPTTGPVRESHEMREPEDVPKAADGNERLTPHQLTNVRSRRADDQRRPRWSPGSSGSFGGGGGGRT